MTCRSSCRVNHASRAELLDDLEAVVCPELYAVILPKIEHPEEVRFLDHLLGLFENRAGTEVGSTLKFCPFWRVPRAFVRPTKWPRLRLGSPTWAAW